MGQAKFRRPNASSILCRVSFQFKLLRYIITYIVKYCQIVHKNLRCLKHKNEAKNDDQFRLQLSSNSPLRITPPPNTENGKKIRQSKKKIQFSAAHTIQKQNNGKTKKNCKTKFKPTPSQKENYEKMWQRAACSRQPPTYDKAI